MIQTAPAKILWESIAQSARLKLLNNVYCVTCKKTTCVGNVKMTSQGEDLIILGICISCGTKVAHVVESKIEKSPKKTKSPSHRLSDGHNPDISDLIQFRSDTKAANLIAHIGKT